MHGIRVMLDRDPEGFVVANHSRFLDDTFEGSLWPSPRWPRLLKRLDGAHPTGPMRFGEPTRRGTFVPARYLG